jgi:hypothetical protein
VIAAAPLMPPRASMSEDALIRAYAGPVVRREPCACGSDVVQRLSDDVPEAVRRHQDTRSHTAWRERNE